MRYHITCTVDVGVVMLLCAAGCCDLQVGAPCDLVIVLPAAVSHCSFAGDAGELSVG